MRRLGFRTFGIAVALALPIASLARAQHADHAPHDRALEAAALDSATGDFVARAKSATARYHDLAVAIADGFRQVGGELPGMGAHWVDVGRIIAGRFAADSPSILIYAGVNGRPTLVGVAYSRLLAPGEAYPDGPVGRGAWHEHNGNVDEEILPLGHLRPSPVAGSTRLAVLHAWIWEENPAGLWVADNWRLPYLRAGLAPRATGARLARTARALALGADGGLYLHRVLASTAKPDSGEDARIAHAIAVASAAVQGVVRAARARGALADDDVARLDNVWSDLWHDVDNALGAAAAERLRALRNLWI